MFKALLIHPAFSDMGFWNYRSVCKLVGARYPAPPLGLITMAAILPQEWEIRLVDMNTRPLRRRDLLWADLVFTGGMLPQQKEILRLNCACPPPRQAGGCRRARSTSQPELFDSADYLVLGETEVTLPEFLADLRRGAAGGTYAGRQRPDLRQSPVPRFDLLAFGDYLMMGVQFCRGCPFDCEFCDIIELYGRTPRTKDPAQVLRELEALHRLGYRGLVDFVDDNFIGHKARVKEFLRALRRWSAKHGYPFYFCTEASLNLADDEELLSLMRDTDFRYVFLGIESADTRVLQAVNKRQNLNRKLYEDLERIQRHGLIVDAGFIIGFDGETREGARAITRIVGRGRIPMAMVGLLYALPNTQLARRLEAEGRLGADQAVSNNRANEVDQTTSGLNFETRRPRVEVLEDFLFVITRIFSPRSYFNRVRDLAMVLDRRPRFRPTAAEMLTAARAFLRLTLRMGLRPDCAGYYWRNLFYVLLFRPGSLEAAVSAMAMFLHYRTQARYVEATLRTWIAALCRQPEAVRRAADQVASSGGTQGIRTVAAPVLREILQRLLAVCGVVRDPFLWLARRR